MIFKNLITVKLLGVNQDRIYKLALKNEIKLKNIQKIDYKTLIFDVETSKFKNLIAICEKNNYNISILKTSGFLHFKQVFFNKIGVFVALFCVVIISLMSQSVLWNIKIYGADDNLTKQIESVLNQYSVKVGVKKTAIDKEKLVQNLLNIKGISMASVSLKGTCLIVNVKQATLKEDVLERS